MDYSASLTYDVNIELVPSITYRDLSRTCLSKRMALYQVQAKNIENKVSWLLIFTILKSIVNTEGEYNLVPFRLDSLAVIDVETDTNTWISEWTVEENVSDYRSWNNCSKAIVINTNENYGGVVNVIGYSGNKVTTSSDVAHKMNYESTFLIPLVRGYLIEGDYRQKTYSMKMLIPMEDLI